jgi:hypothetical protein
MPVTTVLRDEDASTIVSDSDAGSFGHRFSWSSAIAGAVLATAVTVFLLALGSGFGLALTPAAHVAKPTFLTLGAIYFLVAQAFGFAAGGHLAGRLIGPATETAKEEEFRSAAHGLVVWALTVVATAALIAFGSVSTGSSAAAIAASSGKFATQSPTMTGDYVGYWVDMLFRPGPSPSQAWLAGTHYAQIDNSTATDAAPQNQTNPAAVPSTDFPDMTAPHSQTLSTPGGTSSVTIDSGTSATPAQTAPAPQQAPTRLPPKDTYIPPPAPESFTPPASLSADKAEVARIFTVGMANGARLGPYDRERVAALVAQDTGLPASSAQRRVDNAEARMHTDSAQAKETARKIVSYASLWIAASLFFGAIVAAAAAMSARWKDDRVTFGRPRSEPN